MRLGSRSLSRFRQLHTVRWAKLWGGLLCAGLVHSVLSFAMATQAAATCVVNVPLHDVLNMRSGPGARYPVIHSLAPGMCGIRYTGQCSGRWCKVISQGRRGWVHTRFLGEDGGDDGVGGGLTADRLGRGVYCVNVPPGDHLNVRAQPSARSTVVGAISNGYCNVRGTGRCHGIWCQVANHEFTGWVNIRYLRRRY